MLRNETGGIHSPCVSQSVVLARSTFVWLGASATVLSYTLLMTQVLVLVLPPLWPPLLPSPSPGPFLLTASLRLLLLPILSIIVNLLTGIQSSNVDNMRWFHYVRLVASRHCVIHVSTGPCIFINRPRALFILVSTFSWFCLFPRFARSCCWFALCVHRQFLGAIEYELPLAENACKGGTRQCLLSVSPHFGLIGSHNSNNNNTNNKLVLHLSPTLSFKDAVYTVRYQAVIYRLLRTVQFSLLL